MRRVLFTFLLCLFLAPAVVHANPITYSINISIQVQDPGLFLVGSITTDGKLGAISLSDITAFDFDVYTNGDPLFYGTDHVSSSGRSFKLYTDAGDHPLTATSTALLFNFSGAAGDNFALSGGTLGSGFCLEDGSVDNYENECGRVIGGKTQVFLDGYEQEDFFSGTQDVANLSNIPLPTPEPASYVLVVTGLIGALTASRRRCQMAVEPNRESGV